MAHTTPTSQLQTISHSFDPCLLQLSHHIQSSSPDQQSSGTPQSVSSARLRYSSFPRLVMPVTSVVAHKPATGRLTHSGPGVYQQLGCSKDFCDSCAIKREDSPSPTLSASNHGRELVSKLNNLKESSVDSSRSQNRAFVKLSSLSSGSDADDEGTSSSFNKIEASCETRRSSSDGLMAQDPNNRFVICKFGERAGQPTCGAIIKVFHGRRAHLQNHLYKVHWNGDKTGTAECLWGPPDQACPCNLPINKNGMARHILDTPHSFGDRAESATRAVATFNQFSCPHCGKSFSRIDSCTRHVNNKVCRRRK